MKPIFKTLRLIPLGATLLFTGCSDKKSASELSISSFSDMPVIATKVSDGVDSIVVADLTSLPQPYAIKASELIDNLDIVRLDNSEDALIAPGSTWVSDKRIIIYNYNTGVKQYDRSTGKYLGMIGAKGHGPGEYQSPYDISVDEEAGRIYLLGFDDDKIITYDLSGKYIGDIPLANKVPKGIAKVDNKANTVTVFSMIFDGISHPSPVWVQDMEGNIISEAKKPETSVLPDFSNEFYVGINADGQPTYSTFRINATSDTLYSYADSRLRPEFTAKYPSEIPMHCYLSFPKVYVADIHGEPYSIGENQYIIPSQTPIIIDKATLRGAPVKLILDKWGELCLNSEWAVEQKNAHTFALTIDPSQLTEMIDNSNASEDENTGKSSEAMRALRESISDSDNCYVIIGDWKK